MKTPFAGGPRIWRRGWIALLVALASGPSAMVVSAAPAGTASTQTFDRVTFTVPAGFEAAPGSSNHATFRRVEKGSWMLFSVYGGRIASRDLAREFVFDWNDLSSAGGLAAPASSARRVGSNAPAREGGVFVPAVGYVHLVDVDAGDAVCAILIMCGSAEQFRSYRPIMDELLAGLVVKQARSSEPGATVVRAPVAATTTRSVDYVEDGFVWKGADGLEHVPALNVVGRGAGFPASIPGIWQNDHEPFTLELAADGTYASVYSGASISGPAKMGEFAGSVANGSLRIREAGHWKAVGTKLTLTPDRADRATRIFTDRRGGEKANVDFGGPRTYDVTTLAQEYTRNNLVYRTDGIELSGPPAPWYYSPSGKWLIALRRTGGPAAR